MTPKRLRYIALILRDLKQPQAAQELERFAEELEDQSPQSTTSRTVFNEMALQAEKRS